MIFFKNYYLFVRKNGCWLYVYLQLDISYLSVTIIPSYCQGWRELLLCVQGNKETYKLYLHMWISFASNKRVIFNCWLQINMETWIFCRAKAYFLQCFTQTMVTLIICYQPLIAVRICVGATLQLLDIAETRKFDLPKQARYAKACSNKVIHFDNLSKDSKTWAEKVINLM